MSRLSETVCRLPATEAYMMMLPAMYSCPVHGHFARRTQTARRWLYVGGCLRNAPNSLHISPLVRLSPYHVTPRFCITWPAAVDKMEAIKKKLATLKEERDQAIEKAEESEQQKKEAENKADQVNHSTFCGACWPHLFPYTLVWEWMSELATQNSDAGGRSWKGWRTWWRNECEEGWTRAGIRRGK